MDRCKHCDEVILKFTYGFGEAWAHYDTNAKDPSEAKGTVWRYCRLATAEPMEK